MDKVREQRMTDMQKLYDAILSGDARNATAVTQEALDAGADPLMLVTDFMVPAMDEVGKRFEAEDYFVPELLLSARAMKGALALLRPLLAASGTQPTGRVVIGTVKGDLHDIGKNLVASLLEGAGFEVHDLGSDVSPEKFIEAARSKNADIVALSALLTVTMPSMKTTIDALRRAGVRDCLKVMVGGAPVTRAYAEQIGADGFSDNASAAVALARSLMGRT
jgi:5-methyltetrahydrofolate--homocysteine methyltransferase